MLAKVFIKFNDLSRAEKYLLTLKKVKVRSEDDFLVTLLQSYFL